MDLRGKEVTVVGLGRSGIGAARLLLAKGARVFLSDAAESDTLKAHAARLRAEGAEVELGTHTEARFTRADLVVTSPGVPTGLPVLEAARRAGVSVVGDFELAARFCTVRTLAVTGTNGKTTTTELLHAMVAAGGTRTLLAGNNATPFSEAVLADPPADIIVLEVSSYQLEACETFRPWAGAVLNLTPDHLGRHGSMEAYAAAKARLFMNQGAGDIAVLNADDPIVAAMHVPPGPRLYHFSMCREVPEGLWLDREVIRCGRAAIAHVRDCPLPGRHNLANALAALTLIEACGLPWDAALQALRRFRGVEHRIEWVARHEGVDYYNDSKSTNVDSLQVALESFSRPIVLIAGGRGKGAPYAPLAPLIQARVKRLITIGEDAPLLEAAFGGITRTERAADMEDAVLRARGSAAPGDVVLLSPACASFDMYRNFEERGRDFKRCVTQALAAEPSGESR
jgi:UDP-N-acetylmuramoylalanine--D-glutamate ligase